MIIHRLYGSDNILVLITYDVNTTAPSGKKRLQRVAKICVNYGQRVQNSVFECYLDNVQLTVVRNKLKSVIDEANDSLRIYNLGNNYSNRIEHYGVKASYDPEAPLIM